MSTTTFAERVAAWAARTPEIRAVVLIGSRTRAPGDVTEADAWSDWDFHVITARPERFATREWTGELGLGPAIVYGARQGAVGKVTRVTALFPGVESDYVVLPAGQLNLVRRAVKLGLHRRLPGLRRKLGDLAIIARPGHRVIHGEARWAEFYRRVVAEVPDPRLSDAEACRLAERFACDYVWMRRKLARGEFLAAQRMLHLSLAEINFQLGHERNLRRGAASFPEARRIERVLDEAALRRVTVRATPEEESLRAALEAAAETCRATMRELAGAAWQWPAVDDVLPRQPK